MTDFSPPPLRAPRACIACNKKKVRCIFEDNESTCLNCQRHQWPCLGRERRRKRPRTGDSEQDVETPEIRSRRRRTTLGVTAPAPVSPTDNEGPFAGNDQSICSRFGRRDEPASANSEANNYSSYTPDSARIPACSQPSNPYSSAPSLSFMARNRYFDDAVVINEDQARSYPIGDADGPNEDDIQLLRLQGAFELPPRSIREGLINTFIARCSPWMPIIERSWLEESGDQKPSMLLLQSIFVAASRVTSAPAVSAYASTHQFYRRAKALFWSGYEKNPMTVVAAVCILHWYNPEGPEHVSTNTSGFWRYVGVGLAHQIGLHKEPANKRDAALRRRLWWTLFARDCLISAGQGRPLAVDIDDCELAPPCLEDFKDSSSDGALFIAYVEISSILGHLTQDCRRKTLNRQKRQSFENRLYRWTRDLPDSLRLFRSSVAQNRWPANSHSTLAPYSLEARQLHIPYFVCLAIMCRHSPGISPSPAVVLASSFVAGIFEDFLARDEIQFLGPIFTFHLLAAGIGLLSSRNTPILWEKAEASLQTIFMSLEVLAKRWSSAKGSLRALKSIADKQQRAIRPGETFSLEMPREHHPFFEGFGPDISWAWPLFMPSSSKYNMSDEGPADTLPVPRGQAILLEDAADGRFPNVNSSADDYRPLTTILDPHMGFTMGDATRNLADDFFHNQYQGMGDWLFRDLDWDDEAAW